MRRARWGGGVAVLVEVVPRLQVVVAEHGRLASVLEHSSPDLVPLIALSNVIGVIGSSNATLLNRWTVSPALYPE